jgi:hypothetical protein
MFSFCFKILTNEIVFHKEAVQCSKKKTTRKGKELKIKYQFESFSQKQIIYSLMKSLIGSSILMPLNYKQLLINIHVLMS